MPNPLTAPSPRTSRPSLRAGPGAELGGPFPLQGHLGRELAALYERLPPAPPDARLAALVRRLEAGGADPRSRTD